MPVRAHDASRRATPALPSLRLLVEAEPDIHALHRLLEPFAVSGITPDGIHAVRVGGLDTLHVEITFRAEVGLASRLEARIGGLVMVRVARLVAASAAGHAA